MEKALEILTGLSSIIGVPATICLAWTAFIIKDHSKRIEQLEKGLKEADKDRAGELARIYDRIDRMSNDLAYIRGKIEKEDK